jgi:hypothetical protein
MKKPRHLKYTDIVIEPETDSYPIGLPGMPVYLTVRSAKAVGKWLLNAAQYVESRKKKLAITNINES